MNIQDIKDAICNLFDFKIVDETDEIIKFSIISDRVAILNKSETQKAIEEISLYKSDQQVELYDENSYEVIVRNETRNIFMRELVQSDDVNKIEYKLGKPTNRYIIFFLINLANQNLPKILRSGIMPHRLRRLYSEQNKQLEIFDLDIFEVIKDIVPSLDVLQIKSKSPKKKQEFEQLLYAFLFNVGYNLDFAFQPLRFMDEFIQSHQMGRLKRSSISDLEPPKRTYFNDLVLHYHKGISSDSIEHKYLSFYHVLEFFYEKIYNDDILNSIRDELTKPGFSYKRNKDISTLISLIQNRLRYKNEEFQINELEALQLTLTKFVKDLPFLTSELRIISSDLIEYYKSTEVPFSRGNKVNFESDNPIEIYKNLAKRIYLTRNAIVHSKESEKIKYTPYSDDKVLIKEIYLLRLVAEIIIIENSKEL